MRESHSNAGRRVVLEEADAREQIFVPFAFDDGDGEATDNEWGGDDANARGVDGNDDGDDAATDASAVTDARYAPDVADLRDFHRHG